MALPATTHSTTVAAPPVSRSPVTATAPCAPPAQWSCARPGWRPRAVPACWAGHRRRGPADLAGVPEAHRVVEVPGCCVTRGGAAIAQHGDVAVLDAHPPLVRPALFHDASWQPRPRRPVTVFFLPGAGVADLDPAVVGEPAVIVVVVVCHRGFLLAYTASAGRPAR